MSNIIKIIEELRDEVLSMRYDIEPMTKGDNIFVNNIENSQKYIDNLCIIRKVLVDVIGNVDSKLNYAIDKYKSESEKVSSLFSKISNKNSEIIDDKYVKVDKNTVDRETPDLSKSDKFNKIIKELDIGTEYVQITSHLSIKAVIVDTIHSVYPNGQLYYVKSINHFAFYLAGKLWHGNIGNIFVHDTPKKVKTCRFGTYCIERNNCSYYHDPLFNHGGSGKDIRNYTKNTFNIDKEKIFCSKGNLEDDYNKITDEKSHEIYDCAMHEFLCALLLYQLKVRNK